MCRLSNRKVSCTYMRTESCAAAALCCYTAVVASAECCCCFLLLFVIVCTMAKFCWLIESDPSVFFLFIQTRFSFDGTPWQYCVAFTASICLYPR